jgi:hypothetical protein
MSEGMADTQQRNGPPLRTILVRCTEQPCTPARGTGETILIYADGSTQSAGSWGYDSAGANEIEVMPPAPPPSPAGAWELICKELPRSQCEEFATDSYEAINAVGLELEALTMSCVSAGCTSTSGSVEAVATFVDGSEQPVGSWQYVGSGP